AAGSHRKGRPGDRRRARYRPRAHRAVPRRGRPCRRARCRLRRRPHGRRRRPLVAMRCQGPRVGAAGCRRGRGPVRRGGRAGQQRWCERGGARLRPRPGAVAASLRGQRDRDVPHVPGRDPHDEEPAQRAHHQRRILCSDRAQRGQRGVRRVEGRGRPADPGARERARAVGRDRERLCARDDPHGHERFRRDARAGAGSAAGHLVAAPVGPPRGRGRPGLLPGERRGQVHHRSPRRRERWEAEHPDAAQGLRDSRTGRRV
ncbi:MAG: 3-oxoacyl-[acyl-carrier protein] reductase, partial [uncultured Nocardioidaceae bacterium]